MDITTVADDLIVCHDRDTVVRLDNLRPASTHDIRGVAVTTLPRPDGELLCRLATVNDIHFGEVECGRVDGQEGGPIERVLDGEQPYAETMNRGAAAEIAAIDPAVVIVKGDLSQDGRPEEWQAFEACYRGAFGDRLHVVRGNHDAYHGQSSYSGDQLIVLPGVAVALIDTVIPYGTTGRITAEQLDWLDAHAAAMPRTMLSYATEHIDPADRARYRAMR